MNNRDTQFLGSAKQAVEKMLHDASDLWIESLTDEWREDFERTIANYAYDLVEHTLWRSTPASGSTIREYKGLTIQEIAGKIPDMTDWPKPSPGLQRLLDEAKKQIAVGQFEEGGFGGE